MEQKINQLIQKYSLLWIVLAIVLIVAVLGFGYLGIWEWTGFRICKLHGPCKYKTLWDWLQLFIIPIFLIIAAPFVAQVFKKRAEKIAKDTQEEKALQAYFDAMLALLLKGSLQKDAVLEIARMRSLTILHRLDGERKGRVIRFISEVHIFSKVDTQNKKQSTVGSFFLRDLAGMDLRGADLSTIVLAGAYFNKADLVGVSLTKADLKDVFFTDASLDGANLERANLRNANLIRASLDGANLTDANFWGANFQRATLAKATLVNASLEEANFTNASLDGADLTNANLWDATLINATLINANLEGANFRGTDLRSVIGFRKAKNFKKIRCDKTTICTMEQVAGTLLEGKVTIKEKQSPKGKKYKKVDESYIHPKAGLRAADLSEMNLEFANLRGAVCWNADFTNAILTNANLWGAKLTNANLTNANFTGASLEEADFTYANLSKANFTNANLWRADFKDTDLRSVIGFREAKNFEEILCDTTTICTTEQVAGTLLKDKVTIQEKES